MRYILYILIVCSNGLFSFHAKATCLTEDIEIWPPTNKPLPANPTFIITLYGKACKYVNIFSSDSGVSIFHNREVIQLRCIEVILNDSNVHQLIYRPVKLLREYSNYTIDFSDTLIDVGIISSLFSIQLRRYNNDAYNPKASLGVWKTEGSDFTIPLFPKKLIKIKKKVELGYCYRPNQILFKHSIFDSGALIFKFTIKRKGDTTTYTYYCPTLEGAEDRLVSIGTNGLFFPFKLDYGDKFHGTVQAMDAAGNFSKEIHPITFRFRRKYYAVLTIIRQKLFPFETF